MEERKKTPHCKICDQKGHWKGDPICPYYKGKPQGDRPAMIASLDEGDNDDDDDPIRDVKVCMADGSDPEGGRRDPAEGGGSHLRFPLGTGGSRPPEASASGPIYEVFANHLSGEVKDTGSCILDTACKISVAGSAWYEDYGRQLKEIGLDKYVEESPEAA